MRVVAVVVVGVILVAAGTAEGDRRKSETRRIASEGAKDLAIEGDFAAGEFSLKADDIAEAAVVDVSFDPSAIEYDIDYDVKGGTGYLAMNSYNRRKSSIDTEDNKWDIVLSTRYPASLTLEVGACDANFDLGGIPLTDFSLEIGAASGHIVFSKVNPERLEQITIEAGASSLKMYEIGNANFEDFQFSGGVGAFELDFRGQYHGESSIDIDVGLGSADVILPEGVPIRVESNGGHWFSSMKFHNDDLEDVADDTWESPDFDKAKDRIILKVEVGMGSVDLNWKP